MNGLRLTPSQRAWYDELATSTQAAEILDFRHAIIHRVVRIDATVSPGVSSVMTISSSTAHPGSQDAVQQLHAVAAYVEARWREFIPALA